jgi:hypothetical protein
MTVSVHYGAGMKIHTSRLMASTIDTSCSDESLYRPHHCKIDDTLTIGDDTLTIGGSTQLVGGGTLMIGGNSEVGSRRWHLNG